MPLQEVDILTAGFEKGHETAGEDLLATESLQDWRFALRYGRHVKISHLCQVHQTLTSIVIEDGDVIDVGEVVFCLESLNPRQ